MNLANLPDHGDIVDWIDDHGDAAEPDELRRQVEDLVAKVEATTPDGPADRIERFQPFPTEALPEPIRGFVEAGATAIGCDPSYLVLPLLSAVAAAIGNTRSRRLKTPFGKWNPAAERRAL